MKNVSNDLNYCYGVYLNIKAVNDFLDVFKTNEKDRKKIGGNHALVICWIKYLFNEKNVEKYIDEYNNEFVYISKEFLKGQLPIIKISTNTETNLFTILENYGMLHKYNDATTGKRYFRLSDLMNELLDKNYNVVPSKSFKKDKKFWSFITKEYVNNNEFDKWLMNFDWNYIKDNKQLTYNQMKNDFLNYINVCDENSKQKK